MMMNLKQDQERVRDLIKDTLTLLCKNGLHFNKNFLIEGLIGITLDDDQIFLINIKENFVSNTSKNITKEIPESYHNTSISNNKSNVSEDITEYTDILDSNEDENHIKIENSSIKEGGSLISNSNNKPQKRKQIARLENNDNTSRNKSKDSIKTNSYSSNSQLFHKELQTIANNNFMHDSFPSNSTIETQTGINLAKINDNASIEIENFMDEHIDEKNIIQIKDEDEDTENEDSSFHIYNNESGPSFSSFHNSQNSFESTSNQMFFIEKFQQRAKRKKSGRKFDSVPKTQCKLCGQSFKDSRTRTAHMSLIHGFPREFKCQACEQEFLYKKHLQRHLKIKHFNE